MSLLLLFPNSVLPVEVDVTGVSCVGEEGSVVVVLGWSIIDDAQTPNWVVIPT